jgi:hypothetical protein
LIISEIVCVEGIEAMHMSHPGITLRRLMIWVAILGPLFALHISVVRDVMRYETLVHRDDVRTLPPHVLREMYMLSLTTTPSLIGLGILDALIVVVCWRPARNFARLFFVGSFGFLISGTRPNQKRAVRPRRDGPL